MEVRCFNNGYILQLMYFSSKKVTFCPVSLQLRLCGLTNGSTRSITWSLTLSILSSYWLIMFPDTPHLWKQILVGRISHGDPYCQLMLKKKKIVSTIQKEIFFRWGSCGGCSCSAATAGCCCGHHLPPVQDYVSLCSHFFIAFFHCRGSLAIFLSSHQRVDASHTSSRSPPALGAAKQATGWWT